MKGSAAAYFDIKNFSGPEKRFKKGEKKGSFLTLPPSI